MTLPATKRTTRWRVCATGLPPHAHPRAFTSRALLAGRLAFGRARDNRVRRVDADAARERAGDLRVRDRREPVARAGRDGRRRDAVRALELEVAHRARVLRAVGEVRLFRGHEVAE